MAIYGISETSGLEILAETGTDLSRWETEGHFRSCQNLCPNTKKYGGKIISSKVMRKKANAASQAFRHAPNEVQIYRKDIFCNGCQYPIQLTEHLLKF